MPNLTLYFIIGLAVFAAGAGTGSYFTASVKNTTIANNETRYTDNLKAVSDAALKAQQAQDKLRDTTTTQLAAQDAAYQQELANAKALSDRRIADITNGVKRLYVPTRCPASTSAVRADPSAASRPDDTYYAELPRSLGAALSQTGADANAVVGQLTALQAYVRTIRHEDTP